MRIQPFLRHWRLLVLLPAIGMAIAGFSTAATPPQYQSVVTLQLNPAAKSAFLPYSPEGAETDALAASYREVLRSRAFAESAVKRLNLPLAPEVLARSISTSPIPNTNLLRLAVTAARPDDAQRLAQAIAEFFVSEAIQTQAAPSGAAARLAELEETARNYPPRMEALRQQRDRLDQAVTRGDMGRLAELNNLDTRLTSMETNYANLMIEISRTRSSMNTASILDHATLGAPTGVVPLSRALPFGLAAGLGVAVGLILLLDRFDDGIRGPADIVRATGRPPVAIVGRVRPSRQPAVPSNGHVDGGHSPSAVDAFSMLRANLRLAADGPCRTLLIASAGHGEGRTFIASELAVAYAQAGDRVLLVDADLRSPSIHQVFGLSNAHGYLDALSALSSTPSTQYQWPSAPPRAEPAVGRATTAVVEERLLMGIASSEIPNLSILVSGPLRGEPAAVLGSQASARLVEYLGERWDIVIFDTTPLLPVADTRSLALSADAVLLVARAGVTSHSDLAESWGILRQIGRPSLNVVLNDFASTEPLRRVSTRLVDRALGLGEPKPGT
jgi:Mrp family chromosome partitioning ATPase/capsular polysaccharide biosynthesis protein